MGSSQDPAMLRGSESSNGNQSAPQKQEPEECQTGHMATQADLTSLTQAAPTASAQGNRDPSTHPPIECNKHVSLTSSNVSVPATSDRSQDYHTSGEDADQSATASPPSGPKYAVNMLRSSATRHWNDSGDDDEDPLPEHDWYLWRSRHRPSSPSRVMGPVYAENQRHQHGMLRRLRPTPFRDTDDEESISDSNTTSGL